MTSENFIVRNLHNFACTIDRKLKFSANCILVVFGPTGVQYEFLDHSNCDFLHIEHPNGADLVVVRLGPRAGAGSRGPAGGRGTGIYFFNLFHLFTGPEDPFSKKPIFLIGSTMVSLYNEPT